MSDVKQETLDVYLTKITTEPLRNLAEFAVKEYGTEEKLLFANKVIMVLRKLYTKRGIIASNVNPYFIELMETAAFIHNLFTDESWISCFRAREKLQDKAKQFGIQGEHVEHIFTIVEGQLDEGMPVAGARPNPNSPVSDFAMCRWIVKELLHDE